MTPRPVRFGVIGCGLMGREFASAAARWLHLVHPRARPEIIAVCDVSTSLTSWFAEHVPTVRQVTTDYRELLANPMVEAVYCAVPHVLHAEIYAAILAAGKHLFGEKPFGMDRAQNAEIMEAVASRPELMVRCSSEMPFYPGVQKVIAMAQAGDLGEIIEVECAFLHSSDLDPGKAINWKRQQSINGAYGCMGDLGMHVLHVPLRLGWRPTRVSASLVKRFAERPDGKGGTARCDTWDNATITGMVNQADGDFPLVLKTWRIAPGESNSWSLRILGTRKSAYFTTKNPRQWQFMDYHPGGEQIWQFQDLGYQSLFPTITGAIFEFGFTDAIQQMWAAFLDELAGGDARGFGCVTPQETANHHAILTAALQAGMQQETILVDYPSGAI